MSQLLIQIISVDVGNGTTSTKKPYKYLEVTYKNKSFDDKVESKKVMPFSHKHVLDKLEQATKGDCFLITREKNASNYWDWIDIATSNSAPDNKVIANHTPTSQEQTQLYIIRQSSLTNAVKTLTAGIDPETVKETADIYIDFVLGTQKTISDDSYDTDDID